MLRPALGLRFRGDEHPEMQAIVNEHVKPRSERVLDILVEWYVVGRPADRDTLCDRIVECRGAWDRHPAAEISDADRAGVLPMVRGLGHVLYLFGTHAAVLLGDSPTPPNAPPLTDYMGNQWSFWGEVLIPFIRRCRERRDALGLGHALWDRWLPEYDDYYHRRGRYAPPVG